MDLKFKPLISRSIPSIFFEIIFMICLIIGIIIGTNFISNNFENSNNYNYVTQSYEPNLYLNQFAEIIKYIGYGFSFLLLIGLFISPIIKIRRLKNTKYQINDEYLEYSKKFISEKRISIPINEITNIDYTIGFFWDKVFGTGSILVSTAGSNRIDMNINQVTDIVEKYEKLNELLRLNKSIALEENGEISKLNKENISQKLVQKIKPNAKVYFAINFIGAIFSILFLIIYYLVLDEITSNYLVYFFVYLVITALFRTTFGYFACKKKYYDFYPNKLEYYDGFLTLNKSTIPFERITNIDERRSLLERIFGTSTISVETAGSGKSEININYVTNGEELINKLKEVLKEYGRN